MLNFKVGDKVAVDQNYVTYVLTTLPHSAKLTQTIQRLGLLGNETAVVTDIGYILVDGQITCGPLPIHIYPSRTSNILYQGGKGTTFYLPNEEHINSTLHKV